MCVGNWGNVERLHLMTEQRLHQLEGVRIGGRGRVRGACRSQFDGLAAGALAVHLSRERGCADRVHFFSERGFTFSERDVTLCLKEVLRSSLSLSAFCGPSVAQVD